MPLTLTPVTPGSLTLASAATVQSTVVYCSEGLPCSGSLPCGEVGIGFALPDPAPALTLVAN